MVARICPGCGAAVTVLRETPTTLRVGDETIPAIRKHRVCEACGAEFENTHDPDWRREARERHSR